MSACDLHLNSFAVNELAKNRCDLKKKLYLVSISIFFSPFWRVKFQAMFIFAGWCFRGDLKVIPSEGIKICVS